MAPDPDPIVTTLKGPNTPELIARLDRDAGEPLHAQLERALREHVASGRLPAGARLPSTRTLAADLGVARGVVTEAYAQLGAEGWLVGRRGAGTVVAERAARSAGETSAHAGSDPAAEAARRSPRDGAPWDRRPPSDGRLPPIRIDLRYGTPDLTLFPRRRWLAATRAALADLPAPDLGYGDPCGLPGPRAEIAAYLARVRAVEADPERVLITSGTVQGLALVLGALRARGARRVAIEDPGWTAQWEAVGRVGLEPVPVPVDGEGIRADRLAALGADAVLVTPAHQFPTGAVLSAERRQQLVDWAAGGDRHVVEDDYDAECRYDRPATGSLQGLAPDRVVYAGSTSKTLAPALRLGWLVLPSALVDAVAQEKRETDRMAPPVTQLAFARLLAAGDLDRHLRRSRLVYRRRRAALLDALATHLPDAEPIGASAGLHAVALLPPDRDERRIVAGARARGIAVDGLAGLHRRAAASRPALVLGYAAASEEAIDRGVRELATQVRCDSHRGHGHRVGGSASWSGNSSPSRLGPQSR